MTATGATQMTVETEAGTEEQKSKGEGGSAAIAQKSPSAFRTISEVADELEVQQHVLRFWETKFTQIKPLKRGGGRRYYRPEDVLLLKRIYDLLYTEGYTIKGAQKLLKGQGKQQIVQQQKAANAASGNAAGQIPADGSGGRSVPAVAQSSRHGLTGEQRSMLEETLGELREMREMIKLEDAS